MAQHKVVIKKKKNSGHRTYFAFVHFINNLDCSLNVHKACVSFKHPVFQNHMEHLCV